ncbi:MAG TPA: GerMN domain-containing protein [Longimicrobiales bacterium]|nr:GerMN domain-containing protein [Longimicrobiales bacterium]
MPACGGDTDTREPGPHREDVEVVERVRTDTTEPADDVVVQVWNILDERPVAVERRVPEATVESALQALVRGPTEAERQAGHSSWFADSTAAILRSVARDNGQVVVDFHGDMPRLMSGAGTSFGSLMLLAMLDSTVFQFPGVQAVEYRLDGSCAAFGEWLQTGCEGVQRRRPEEGS